MHARKASREPCFSPPLRERSIIQQTRREHPRLLLPRSEAPGPVVFKSAVGSRRLYLGTDLCGGSGPRLSRRAIADNDARAGNAARRWGVHPLSLALARSASPSQPQSAPVSSPRLTYPPLPSARPFSRAPASDHSAPIRGSPLPQQVFSIIFFFFHFSSVF